MKTLLMMRHGKSRWDEAEREDRERRLAERGKRQARGMGKQLAEADLSPQLIVSSPARRALSTAKRVAKGLDSGIEVVKHNPLYYGNVRDHYHAVKMLSDDLDVVLLVGHNPTLEEFVAALAREAVTLPTCTVVCIDLPLSSWSELDSHTGGRIRSILRPKDTD